MGKDWPKIFLNSHNFIEKRNLAEIEKKTLELFLNLKKSDYFCFNFFLFLY